MKKCEILTVLYLYYFYGLDTELSEQFWNIANNASNIVF